MQLLGRCVRQSSTDFSKSTDHQTIGGIGMRPIWLGSCDISASNSLPEGRIFRDVTCRRIFLVRASRSKDGQIMMHFKQPKFLHWKKSLKSPPKSCHRQRHVKLIEDPARFAYQHWKHVGGHGSFIPYEVCGVDEFSCLTAPCYFASRGVIDGNGNLKALVWDQYLNRRDERLARENSEGYMPS